MDAQHVQLCGRGRFLVTPDRVAVDIDEAAEEVFGYPEGELVNQSSELLHVDREHYLEVGRRMKKKKNSRPNFNDPRRWRPSVLLQEGWVMTSTTCWLVY